MDQDFALYHGVLNRAVWSSLEASHILLGLLITAFAPSGPLVLGIDETLERRRGKKIAAAGIDRDPVRSSRGHVVEARAVRWISLMLRVPIPWATRTGALPVLSVLAPSERSHQEQGRRHKTITHGARQMVRVVRRWYPEREIVLVGDTAYAVIDFLCATCVLATVVTRLRLDARLFTLPPPRVPGQRGRPRLVGTRLPSPAARVSDPATVWAPPVIPLWDGQHARLIEVASGTAIWHSTGKPQVAIRWVLIRDPEGTFAPQALLCTTLATSPARIVGWFILRWAMECTFSEVRTHLGVETGRGWSDKTIRRTTPALLGLFSFVTLLAHDQADVTTGTLPVRPAAWYPKSVPTFSDALALVRRSLWVHLTLQTSPFSGDLHHSPRSMVEHLCDTLCDAA